MIKLFYRLIACIRELGGKIIAANFQRIVLCTPHRQLSDAHEYIEFLLNAIRARDIFSFLQLSPKTFWGGLIWLENENFAALSLSTASTTVEDVDNHSSPELNDLDINEHNNSNDDDDGSEDWDGSVEHDDDNDLDTEEGQDDDNSAADYDLAAIKRAAMSTPANSRPRVTGLHNTPQIAVNHNTDDAVLATTENTSANERVIQRWNLVSRLSPLAGEYFYQVIDHFVEIYEDKMLQVSLNNENEDEHKHINEDEAHKMAMIDLRQWIDTELTDALLGIVDDIRAHSLPMVTANNKSTTSNDQSNNQTRSQDRESALSFVKAITYILSLETILKESVSSMRRLLLVQVSTVHSVLAT
jgi:hypothetical protein